MDIKILQLFDFQRHESCLPKSTQLLQNVIVTIQYIGMRHLSYLLIPNPKSLFNRNVALAHSYVGL